MDKYPEIRGLGQYAIWVYHGCEMPTYLARLRGVGGVVAAANNLPPTSLRDQSGNGTTTDVSPVPRLDVQSPSILSLVSPDFACMPLIAPMMTTLRMVK